jgi:hypothetical protein
VTEFAIRVPSVDELLDPYSVESLERRPLREDVRDRILRAWIDTRGERPSHLMVELPVDQRRAGLDSGLRDALFTSISQGLVVLGWVAMWQPAQQVFHAVSRRLSRGRYRELSQVPIEIAWT